MTIPSDWNSLSANEKEIRVKTEFDDFTEEERLTCLIPLIFPKGISLLYMLDHYRKEKNSVLGEWIKVMLIDYFKDRRILDILNKDSVRSVVSYPDIVEMSVNDRKGWMEKIATEISLENESEVLKSCLLIDQLCARGWSGIHKYAQSRNLLP